MPPVKVLAKDWKLEISDMGATPAFTTVKGLDTFTFSGGKTDADTTTFDSEGWEEHLVAGRSRTLTGAGKYLEDDSGDQDPGQEMIEQAAEQIGEDSLVDFKLTSPSGKVRSFKASVDLGDIGGGNNDPTSFGFELKVSGQIG